MADLLRSSPRVTRSLRNLPRTKALLEIFDCRHDARIIRGFRKARAQWKTPREKECFVLPMTCCAATTGENPKKGLGASQLPSCKLTFGAILKCTTQCLKSCGADNLEQMTKTDNFGTTWVENVNRVNLCISAS